MPCKYKDMRDMLICAAESQLTHLEDVDAAELGEVIDMIKDLEEAEYYCAVTKAMYEAEEHEKEYKSVEKWDDWKYNSRVGNMPMMEKEWHHIPDDSKDGKSYHSRRTYMEAKESHVDKTMQMKELERYAQELTSDIVEMVEGATPEEKQYLSKKIAALANKITQLTPTT